MTVSVLSWTDAASRYGTQWSELIDAADLNPSMHPDWMAATLSAHGLLSAARVTVVIQNGDVVGIIPFLVRKVGIAGFPIRCLDMCSNVLSYHAGLAAVGDIDRIIHEVCSSALLPAHDVIRFGNLVSGGPASVALNRVSGRDVFSYPGERSPYIDMTMGWEEYLKSLPKKMRANIKGCIRSMQQAGETGMRWYESGANVDQLIEEMLVIEAGSWKAADGKAIRKESAEGRYYKSLLPLLVKQGLMANVLYVHDKPVAYVLCATWKGWAGQLKTSFVEGVRDAGFRVIHASIERAFQSGFQEYDFLGDAAPHKLRWTSLIRAHEDRWLFAGHIRGRSLALLKRSVDRLKRDKQQASMAPATSE
jgi:CelD/BcsL family acetyltransferase involved in cellulose biosynthesis